jgi:hypothetical protein
MFNIFNLKGILIGTGLALVVGFGSGVWVRDAFCDAAALRLEVDSLKLTIAAGDAAREQDEVKVRESAVQIEQLESAIRDAQDKIARSDGQCLSADDTDSLRTLWQKRQR